MRRQTDSNFSLPASRESSAGSDDETRIALLAVVSRRQPMSVLGVLQYWLGLESQSPQSTEDARRNLA